MMPGFRQYCPQVLILGVLLLLPLLFVACGGGGDGGSANVATDATLVATPSPELPAFEGKPLVVYVVGPLSGPDAQRGQAQAAGARVAADQLNRDGGLLGREILVKAINDFGDPEGALEAVAERNSAWSRRVANDQSIGNGCSPPWLSGASFA